MYIVIYIYNVTCMYIMACMYIIVYSLRFMFEYCTEYDIQKLFD